MTHEYWARYNYTVMLRQHDGRRLRFDKAESEIQAYDQSIAGLKEELRASLSERKGEAALKFREIYDRIVNTKIEIDADPLKLQTDGLFVEQVAARPGEPEFEVGVHDLEGRDPYETRFELERQAEYLDEIEEKLAKASQRAEEAINRK